MRKQNRSWLIFAGILVLVGPQSLIAQDPVQRVIQQRTGETLTQAQILERIKRSGLTREQVRAQLRAAGQDPTLADAYFDQIELERAAGAQGRRPATPARPLPQPTAALLDALTRIGIVEERSDTTASAVAQRDSVKVDSAALKSQVFGRQLFSNATAQFDPVTAGPVDADYQLGPGDQFALVITGDVERVYTLDVTRDGFVVIPDVGQVPVIGRTLGELNEVLFNRLSRVYSGISRSPGATTRFDVSLTKVRSLLVYLVGDVVRPSAYQVSAVSKAFNALYRAGGPTDEGSFRNIEVRRGGRTVARIDVYDYLLRADTRNDVRLQQGDIVFVPPAGPQVTLSGSIRRPGIYELKNGEGLTEALSFAGGLQSDAFVRRIQIDRILPIAQQQPGKERVLIDVDLQKLGAAGQRVALQDGDRIRVFSVLDERRNRIAIAGDVNRPGEYEYRAGMTAAQLIEQASGLQPSAYTPTAHVVRLDPRTGRNTLIRISLGSDTLHIRADRFVLEDLDSLQVFGRETLLNKRTVAIDGFVKKPGVYPLAEGMTVRDVILSAGGFLPGALEYQAEVARRLPGANRNDTLAIVRRVPVRVSADPDVPELAVREDSLVRLQDGDQIFVRRMPGYQSISTVEVSGEVVFPGNYALERRSMTISALIRAAGGLAPEAYVPGFRLIRGGKPVAADLGRALRQPGSRWDLVVEPGDGLVVPTYDPTVLVTGAVAFEARVPYTPGRGLDYYLRRAGGTTENANRGRVSVQYANGEIETTQRFLFRDDPTVRPGSTIVVPAHVEGEKFDWENFLSRTLAVLSTMATVAIAAAQLR